MSFSRRIKSIYLSQVKAIKDRLDRIDVDDAMDEPRPLERSDAADELARSQEPGGRYAVRPAPAGQRVEATQTPRDVRPSAQASPLAQYYKVLALEDGADFTAVEAAYNELVARCAPERFPAGSEEQRTVIEIRKRVDDAFDKLRDALDPTAGRFDKLEL